MKAAAAEFDVSTRRGSLVDVFFRVANEDRGRPRPCPIQSMFSTPCVCKTLDQSVASSHTGILRSR